MGKMIKEITNKLKRLLMFQFRLKKGKILMICLEDGSLQEEDLKQC
jgi:hypothetical protein